MKALRDLHQALGYGILAVILMTILISCAQRKAAPAPLRIGVLPILDALPLYVAEREGYFAAAGVEVTLVPVASAAERDQLLQAGQLDGGINDLAALALYNREGIRLVGVRYAMQATSTAPQFRILAAGNTGITAPEQLRGVQIGVSQGTVIEYVTERLLEAEGLAPTEIAILAVPRIPERLALLGAGQLQAATLPEPLATLAMQQGARVILDDTRHPQYSCSVFAFRQEIISAQPEAIRGFLMAVEQASAHINADKTQWDDVLVAQNLIPPSLLGTYTLPDYPGAAVPTREQFEDVVRWLRGKELLNVAIEYVGVIDAGFLP